LAVQPQDGKFRYKNNQKQEEEKNNNGKTKETWQTKIFIAQVHPQCFGQRGNHHRPCEHWQQLRWQL
jgi:hypothetical protein